MPELPEVEVVRRGLLPLSGLAVEGVDVMDARAVTRHAAGAADFEARLAGAVLGEPARRGKFLWVPLVDATGRPAAAGTAVLVHLGMSGQVLVDTERRTHRHERVRIALTGGTELVFADQRTFGSLALDTLVPPRDRSVEAAETSRTDDRVPSQVAHIARDPLDGAFSDRDFVRRIRGRRTEVKRALLDQGLVSGIGNIYADEALWHARVHPRQPTDALSAVAAGRVLEAARAVMQRALAEGGTSFDALYVNVNGRSGYFSRSLRAYGRQGEPCARCGRPIVRESFMNRGSHYCAHCQRIRG
ncbi:MAG: bifunctional DNA-formamidopyrimidine glycosylase/DNA-(apurinic or apyrimidinic site) lyase [Microbacteriaceae bacterium]|nr:bifunctional DNA-formamidopyrimidine glycosylase/DNA-(apurinic or apyrimidinic site) lyase [Microbacteriaceae bacterium]